MNIFWIQTIFQHEFGFSDVRANYSRVYSWMANQFGHMTLGLATTLFYFWVIETISAGANSDERFIFRLIFFSLVAGGAVLVFRPVWVSWFATKMASLKRKPDPDAVPVLIIGATVSIGILMPILASLLEPFCSRCPKLVNAGLVALVLAVLAGAVLLALKSGRSPDDPEETGLRSQFYAPLTQRTRWGLIGLVFLLLPAAGWAAAVVDAPTETIFSPVLASIVAGTGVIAVARDWRVALMGVLAIWGAALVATDYFYLDLHFGFEQWTVRRSAGLALGVLFGGLSYLLFCRLNTNRNRQNRHRKFYLAGGCALGSLFVFVNWSGLGPDWQVPVAAAIASMAIWTVKEFGSDLPNVQDELITARKRRSGAWPISPLPGPGQDGLGKIENSYYATAVWDACSDGLFYFAGAWIAGGVLSNSSILTTGPGAWTVGSELLGATIFLVVFIAGGRNWAYRQQAIDQTGVDRANMLAVIDFPVGIESNGRRSDETDLNLGKLFDFARATQETAPGLSDHLIVFGAGRHCNRLANALVTEAALTSLAPKFAARLKDKALWRRARKLSFSRLVDYDPANLMVAEAPYTPLYDLALADPASKKLALRTISGPARRRGEVAIFGAHLIAITRCPVLDLQRMLSTLSEEKKKRLREVQSVWFFPRLKGDPAARCQVVSALEQQVGIRTDWVALP